MTPHFTLAEFTASATARDMGIDNALPPELLADAQRTLDMLERIRGYLTEALGRPVPLIITSGYRCLALNAAIGSRGTSDHVQARAVDFRAPAYGSPTLVCRALAPQVSALGIGQLINEYPGGNGWVHVSTRVPASPANRVITITARGTALGVQDS